MSEVILVVDDEADVEALFRQQFRRDLKAGRFGLEFAASAQQALQVIEETDGRAVLHQRALYHPHGLLGDAYWWAVWPFHGIVFGGMQRNIARAAEATEQRRSPAPGRAAASPTSAEENP